MKRRVLLAAGTAASIPLVGCLGSDLGAEGDAVTPSNETGSRSDGDCGPADQPLSALLTDRIGDPSHCPDSAFPSLAIENERGEALTVAVDIDGTDALTETYTLESGERVVESRAVELGADVTGTVTVDGDDTRVEWPEQSCYRHGIAMTSDGVENGWLEPLQGPGDTQHDCYPGDSALLSVGSLGEARTVTVTITDLCAGTEATETFDVAADDGERSHLLTSGGMYDLEIDVDGGESKTYEFHEGCWGVHVSVEEDGEIRLHPVGVD